MPAEPTPSAPTAPDAFPTYSQWLARHNDGDLVACFDENIPESVVRKIAERKPLRTVFRDSGFADSPAKINMYEIFKIYMPEDADDITKRVRVI